MESAQNPRSGLSHLFFFHFLFSILIENEKKISARVVSIYIYKITINWLFVITARLIKGWGQFSRKS